MDGYETFEAFRGTIFEEVNLLGPFILPPEQTTEPSHQTVNA